MPESSVSPPAAGALRIAMAQVRVIVGDLAGNTRRAIDAATQAADAGADVVLLPELTLLGYPPDDLLLRPEIDARCQAALDELATATAELPLALVVGAPVQSAGDSTPRRNAAWVLRGGTVLARAEKKNLPNYGVFDEMRYFSPGEGGCVVEIKGRPLGILVCEDIWTAEPAADLARAGAQILLGINASPYHWGKREERRAVVSARVRETGLPMVYLNQVGGQDDLVFDGDSFVVDAAGHETHSLPAFASCLGLVDVRENGDLRPVSPQVPAVPLTRAESIHSALVLAVRDYIDTNGFAGAIIGLSGGIDSAVTLAIAVDALGPERVTSVMMPSRYTAQMSLDDAAEQSRRLGVSHHVLSIEGPYEALLEALDPALAGLARDVTEENLQARCRGTMLMALSNKMRSLVLATGNKSEMAVGYATLYGDMAGGFAPLCDVSKTRVYELARWRNHPQEVIPQRVIDRAPSAELAEDQADTDSLPPYEVLDPILEALIERDASVASLVEGGADEETVRRVSRMLVGAEYKRRQAPVGPRVTSRAFGRERRYPVTSRYVF